MSAETDAPASILAVCLRVAKLDAAGLTPAGAGNMYVTDALVKFSWQPDTEAGLDLTQRKGNGDLCVFGKTADVAKRYMVTLDLCSPDPELEVMISGGVLLTVTGATVGQGAPKLGADPTPNGVSIEVWSSAIEGDSPPAADPFFWWPFPKVKFEKKTQRTLEAGILANSFEGYAFENPAWDNGPNNDWELNSDRVWQVQRTDSFPTPGVGVVATPSQA